MVDENLFLVAFLNRNRIGMGVKISEFIHLLFTSTHQKCKILLFSRTKYSEKELRKKHFKTKWLRKIMRGNMMAL